MSAQAALFLIGKFEKTKLWKYRTEKTGKPKKNSVFLSTNTSLAEEEYILEVQSETIKIQAATAKGFFYATQTLLQLLPKEINSIIPDKTIKFSIKNVEIKDKPRFSYRGFMLDVSRFFMPKEEIKVLLDALAFHKINTFHWHLTDDNGWRIEIKKYRRLTDIGAWRVNRENLFPTRSNSSPGEAATVGGYYTQTDIKEIVKYAAELHIEIIPEIDIPAHSNAALAAYPQLACPHVYENNYISVIPGGGGKSASNIYCGGNDSVFRFLEDIFDEVIQLFPSKYIHIGGDEAIKDNWKKCQKCQKRMAENNIPNEEELQSYFIKRINKYLMSKGKNIMGWDELTDSEIPENSTIFGWRGAGLSAEKAGKLGFNYIKSPALKYYFIRYQGPQWFEPFTYFGNITLRDVYEYEPLSDKEYPASVTNHMKGVEACLWTEFVTTSADAQYLVFPRLSAFAETAWTQPNVKNWKNYIDRLDNTLAFYNNIGLTYAKSMYNIDHKVTPKNGRLQVDLSNIRPDFEIRYTLDGSEPKANSSLYKNSLELNPGDILRAATFKNNDRKGRILPLNILSHKACGKNVISKNQTAYVLTNGIRGSEKMTDGEWLDFYDTDAEFVVDMGENNSLKRIEIGMLNNAGMGIHLPSYLLLEVSADGEIYKKVVEKEFPEPERFQNGLFTTTNIFEVNQQNVRFIRIKAKNPGTCPDAHLRAGQKTRMDFDEIIVY